MMTLPVPAAWKMLLAERAAITFGIWFLSALFVHVFPVLVGWLDFSAWTLLAVPLTALSGFLLSMTIFPFILRLLPHPGLLQVAALIGIVLACGLAQSIADFAIWHGDEFLVDPAGSYWLLRIGNAFLIYPWVFGLYVAVIQLLLAFERSRVRAAELGRIQAEAAWAELAALRYQLSPKVVASMFDAALALIDRARHVEAEYILSRLALFLRSSLTIAADRPVMVDEELAGLDAYLAMQAACSGAPVDIGIECPDHLHDALMPGFILQPLVQEALAQDGSAHHRMRISIGADDTRLRIRLTVERANAFSQLRGATLIKVRTRLRLFHGDKAAIQILEGREILLFLPLAYAGEPS